MNLSFLDTLADLASKEMDGISSLEEAAPVLPMSPKRPRAYSESFVRDQTDKNIDWEETKQRLLLLSASSLLSENASSPSASSGEENSVNTVATSSMLERYDSVYNRGGRIGVYTREERLNIIKRFHEKRKRRVWKKKIRYHCRKNLADRRLRVKGRFIKAGSDAYYALQASGVITESGELAKIEEDNEEDDDDDGSSSPSNSDVSTPAHVPTGGKNRSRSNSCSTGKKVVNVNPMKLEPKAVTKPEPVLGSTSDAATNGYDRASTESASVVNNEMDVEAPGSPVRPDSNKNPALFEGIVRSPRSESAARDSLSLLLSMADEQGLETGKGDGSVESKVPSGADSTGWEKLSENTTSESMAATDSSSSDSEKQPPTSMLGLYLLGRAISSENLDRSIAAEFSMNVPVSTAPVNAKPVIVPSNGAGTGSTSSQSVGEEGSVDTLLTSKRMRRHSIAY